MGPIPIDMPGETPVPIRPTGEKPIPIDTPGEKPVPIDTPGEKPVPIVMTGSTMDKPGTMEGSFTLLLWKTSHHPHILNKPNCLYKIKPHHSHHQYLISFT